LSIRFESNYSSDSLSRKRQHDKLLSTSCLEERIVADFAKFERINCARTFLSLRFITRLFSWTFFHKCFASLRSNWWRLTKSKTFFQMLVHFDNENLSFLCSFWRNVKILLSWCSAEMFSRLYDSKLHIIIDIVALTRKHSIAWWSLQSFFFDWSIKALINSNIVKEIW
jgi:hypothetical protein